MFYRPSLIKSPVSWVGNKAPILPIIYSLFPLEYGRFVEVFGGSGSVLLGKPPDPFEVYNDFDRNLVNLFHCMKERTMATIRELGFCNLNSRADFQAIKRFFQHEQFDDRYLTEEMELTEILFPPPAAEELQAIRQRITNDYDVRRAAMYLKLLRYSYSSGKKSFASQPFDLRRLFGLIQQLETRLANVVVENQDFETLIHHYDRPDTFFYLDPPYFSTEDMYTVEFAWADHVRLRDTAANMQGRFLLSIIVTCGVKIGGELLARQKEKGDFEQLAKLVTVEKPSAAPDPSNSPIASMPPDNTDVPEEFSAENEPAQRDLSELFTMNDDFIGWLCIPGTDINYPLMHTPDDPEKYLRRNFHGEYSESGVPFLDFRCALDSDNLIIYGHNMMNGTMFAGLQGYVQEDFCKAHPVIEFQTKDGCAEYQVFAVAWVKSNDDWYKVVNLGGAKDFNSAVEKITGKTLFTINPPPEYGQQILTLSTCYDSANNGRLLVLAAKI